MRPFSSANRLARRFRQEFQGAEPTTDGSDARQLELTGDVESQEHTLAISCRLFPTLRAIDQARGELGVAFATGPHAARLEQFARSYVENHWSDMIWLTGNVDQGHWEALCAALEH